MAKSGGGGKEEKEEKEEKERVVPRAEMRAWLRGEVGVADRFAQY